MLFGFLIFFQRKEISNELIDESQNKIQFSSEQLKQNISDLLDTTKSNRNIVHIGDSHIQIGEFSKGIKTELANQTAIQESWFFPAGINEELYHPIFKILIPKRGLKYESVRNDQKTLNLGITGRTFQLEKKKNILFCTSKTPFIKLEFLHLKNQHFEFELNNKICNSKITNPVDEHYAITEIGLKKPILNLKLVLKNKSNSTCEFYALRINHDSKNLSYSNFGVSGACFHDFINSNAWQNQLKALRPKLLIVTLGTNDSYKKDFDSIQFKSEIEFFTHQIKETSPNTSLILMSAPDTKFKQQTPLNLKFINQFIQRHCKQNNIAFWDWHKIMGGENSMINWEKQKMSSGDFLHFSSAGYQLFGRNFVKALLGVLNT